MTRHQCGWCLAMVDHADWPDHGQVCAARRTEFDVDATFDGDDPAFDDWMHMWAEVCDLMEAGQ